MKKIKKTMLTFGALASIVAPIAASVSCGTSADGTGNPSNSTAVTIVAEKGWVPSMTKLIKDFSESEDGAALMKENGVGSIGIKEAGAFDMADMLSSKGYKDSGVSDVVLLPGDRLKGMMEQGYIKAFSEKTLEEFATKEIGAGEVFLKGAIQSAAPGKSSDSEFFAVPQNVESMVPWQDVSATSNDKHLTVVSDLWKANGFFNTDAGNLKDIVTIDQSNGEASYNDNIAGGTEDFLKAGFKRLIGGDTAINGYTSGDMLSSDASIAAPKVQQHFVANKLDSSIIAGPWEKDSIEEALGGSKIHTVAIDGYNQWAGGWNFTLNARISDKEQTVLEKFIGYILDSKNAKDVYEGMDKMSPTTMGSTTLKGALTDDAKADVTGMYTAAEGLKERPTAAEFGVVWGAYASVIETMGTDIEAIDNATKADAAATKFASDFKVAIVKALSAA